jgi:hypothetical protein
LKWLDLLGQSKVCRQAAFRLATAAFSLSATSPIRVNVREISTWLSQLFLRDVQRFFKPPPSTSPAEKPPISQYGLAKSERNLVGAIARAVQGHPSVG